MKNPRISQKIKEIEENLALIKENLPDNLGDFLQLGLVKDGIYKRLEHSIQDLIDIFSLIYTSLNLGVPSNIDDIFAGLSTKKVFSKEIISLTQEMKGMRNILVHQYGRIDDAIVFYLLQERLGDFEKIINSVEIFLKKK